MNTPGPLSTDRILSRILLPRQGEVQDVRMLYLLENEDNKRRLHWDNRFSMRVPAAPRPRSRETSSLTFPASYWRAGPSSIRSADHAYRRHRLDLVSLESNGTRVATTWSPTERVTFDLALKNFEDGGSSGSTSPRRTPRSRRRASGARSAPASSSFPTANTIPPRAPRQHRQPPRSTARPMRSPPSRRPYRDEVIDDMIDAVLQLPIRAPSTSG